MPYSFSQKISGVIFRPRRTFLDLEDEPLGTSLIHFLKVSALFSVLMTIVAYSVFNILVPKRWAMASQVFQPQYFFVFLLISVITVPLIVGIWLHVWVYLFGGRRGIGQTLKTVMYSYTFFFVISWVPVIGLIGGALSTLYPQSIGIRELHHLPPRRATGAVCVAAFLPVIAFVGILVMAFVAPSATFSILTAGIDTSATAPSPYLLNGQDLPDEIAYFNGAEVDAAIIDRDAKELGCLHEYTATYAEEKPSSAGSRRIMHYVKIFPQDNATTMVQLDEAFYNQLVPPRNAEELSAPEIGDICISYRIPGVGTGTVGAYDSYCITFAKGEVYEKFLTVGPSPDYDLLKDLALRAGEKIP